MRLLLEFLSNEEMKKQLKLLALKLTKHVPGKIIHNPAFKAGPGESNMYRFNPGIKQLEKYLFKGDDLNEVLLILLPIGSLDVAGNTTHIAYIVVAITGDIDFVRDVSQYIERLYDKDDWSKITRTSLQRPVPGSVVQPERVEQSFKITGTMKEDLR